MAISSASLSHLSVSASLYGAIRRAVNAARHSAVGTAPVHNKQGKVALNVVYARYSEHSRLIFLDCDGKDVTCIVKKALHNQTEECKAKFTIDNGGQGKFWREKHTVIDVWKGYSHL